MNPLISIVKHARGAYNRAKVVLGVATLALAISSCDRGGMLNFYDPYSGMSDQEVVEEVKTYDDGQTLAMSIKYQPHGGDQHPYPGEFPFIAKTQSLEWTRKRGKGVCRDAAVASAAALLDDGVPALYFHIGLKDSAKGHAVHAFPLLMRDENGQEVMGWGSNGINWSDKKRGKRTLDDLAQSVARGLGDEATGWTLHDLSALGDKLVTGTHHVEGRSYVVPNAFPVASSGVNYISHEYAQTDNGGFHIEYAVGSDNGTIDSYQKEVDERFLLEWSTDERIETSGRRIVWHKEVLHRNEEQQCAAELRRRTEYMEDTEVQDRVVESRRVYDPEDPTLKRVQVQTSFEFGRFDFRCWTYFHLSNSGEHSSIREYDYDGDGVIDYTHNAPYW